MNRWVAGASLWNTDGRGMNRRERFLVCTSLFVSGPRPAGGGRLQDRDGGALTPPGLAKHVTHDPRLEACLNLDIGFNWNWLPISPLLCPNSSRRTSRAPGTHRADLTSSTTRGGERPDSRSSGATPCILPGQYKQPFSVSWRCQQTPWESLRPRATLGCRETIEYVVERMRNNLLTGSAHTTGPKTLFTVCRSSRGPSGFVMYPARSAICSACLSRARILAVTTMTGLPFSFLSALIS